MPDKTYVVSCHNNTWLLHSTTDLQQVKRDLFADVKARISAINLHLNVIGGLRAEHFSLEHDNIAYLTRLMQRSCLGDLRNGEDTTGLSEAGLNLLFYRALNGSPAMTIVDPDSFGPDPADITDSILDLLEPNDYGYCESQIYYYFEPVKEQPNMCDFEKYCLRRDKEHRFYQLIPD
jgi:hypothetical protein